MKATITEDAIVFEGMPPVNIEGAPADALEILGFVNGAMWAMSRITEEAGMILASDDARDAIKAARRSK